MDRLDPHPDEARDEALEREFEERREARTRSVAALFGGPTHDPDAARRKRVRDVHRAEKAGKLIADPDAYVDQTGLYAPF